MSIAVSVCLYLLLQGRQLGGRPAERNHFAHREARRSLSPIICRTYLKLFLSFLFLVDDLCCFYFFLFLCQCNMDLLTLAL